MKSRFSLTLTVTVSGVAGVGSAVIVNSALSPSVMGEVPASILNRGLSLSLTMTVAMAGLPTL